MYAAELVGAEPTRFYASYHWNHIKTIKFITNNIRERTTYISRCSFSMMVKWANDGLLQANDGKMLVNDGEMLVNDVEMSVW